MIPPIPCPCCCHSTHGHQDDQKTASELQQEQKAQQQVDSSQSSLSLFCAWSCDVTSVALYPCILNLSILAVLCQAGLGMSQQCQGCIILLLPPIANWNKGSSIEAGPKVGIPLMVHPSAMTIQPLVTQVIMAFSATLLDGTCCNRSPRNNQKAGPGLLQQCQVALFLYCHRLPIGTRDHPFKAVLRLAFHSWYIPVL
jgi:hypothetical protein